MYLFTQLRGISNPKSPGEKWAFLRGNSSADHRIIEYPDVFFSMMLYKGWAAQTQPSQDGGQATPTPSVTTSGRATEACIGPRSPSCVLLPSMPRPRAHLQTKMLNVFKYISSKQPWCSGRAQCPVPTCTQITLAAGKSGHSLGLPSILHPSVESWDDFSPWIPLEALCVRAEDHLSYFHICFWMRMPLWVVRGVRLCSTDPDIAGSKEKSQLTLCPSREPRERAWEMYLLTHLVM